MLVIPAIELRSSRSPVVSWPGASAGVGAPTDRPEVIAGRFVTEGARLVHLVDLRGAKRGRPANLEAISRVAATVAVPFQVAGGRVEVLVAGGISHPDGIRRLRDAGVGGVILGEVLLSGQLRYPAALEAAA